MLGVSTSAGSDSPFSSPAISPWVAATLNRPGLSSLIASATLALDMGVLVAAVLMYPFVALF